MLNYIFAGWYRLFLKKKDYAPIYASVNMMTIMLMALFFVGAILLRKYSDYNIFPTSTTVGKLLVILFCLSTIFILYRFYRKNVTRIWELYNGKSTFFRNLWAFLSIILLIIPLVLCAQLLTK